MMRMSMRTMDEEDEVAGYMRHEEEEHKKTCIYVDIEYDKDRRSMRKSCA